jgi:hypothetical protein
MLLTIYFVGVIVFALLFRMIPVPESVRLPWYFEIPVCLVIGLFWPLVVFLMLGFFMMFFLFGL